MCRHRQAPSQARYRVDMTVVDDNYTGHVEAQTAARRTLPGASIVKVSVGPMDNNAYLVTCSQTGETLLIDAANDPEILLELIERFAPKLSLIVTSHQHFDHVPVLLDLDDDVRARRRVVEDLLDLFEVFLDVPADGGRHVHVPPGVLKLHCPPSPPPRPQSAWPGAHTQ
jgi:glyoxylase-like metal-dependent hydrolase (beta-lactamase superfamily II)